MEHKETENVCVKNMVWLGPVKTNNYMRGCLEYFGLAFVDYFKSITNQFYLGLALFRISRGVFNWKMYRTFFMTLFNASYFAWNHVNQFSARLRNQIEINKRTVHHVTKGVIPQSELEVGDRVFLHEGCLVPADCLLLSSSSDIVTVNERDLDGERNQKIKTSLLSKDSVVESINAKLAFVCLADGTRLPYKDENILFGGTRLTHVAEDCKVFAHVIAVGNDCRIMNVNLNRDYKQTPIELMIERICTWTLIPLLLFSILGTLIVKTDNSFPVLKQIDTFMELIMFLNTIIPMGLQFYYDTASRIVALRLERHHKIEIPQKGIKSIQSQPTAIVTDKTGTLTTNRTILSEILTRNEEDVKVRGILACNGTLISPRGDLLEVDAAEYCLMNHLARQDNNINVIENSPTTIEWWEGEDEGSMLPNEMSRLVMTKYNPDIECKYAIVACNESKTKEDSNSRSYELHVQGTPDAIKRYAATNTWKEDLVTATASSSPKLEAASSYKRVIAYGMRSLTQEDVDNILRDGVKPYLKDLHSLQAYVFLDLLIPQIDKTVQAVIQKGYDWSLCTGDSFEASCEVLQALGFGDAKTCLNIDTMENFRALMLRNRTDETKQDHKILAVNGRLLEVIEKQQLTTFFMDLLKTTQVKCIYRATPSSKEKYVSLMKESHRVLMIGDGANDVAALLASDLAVAVNGESDRPKMVADVCIQDWNQLPTLLEDFVRKSSLVRQMSLWILMQHTLKAYSNLTLFVMTAFTLYSERDEFYAGLCFNICCWILLSKFSWNEDLPLENAKRDLTASFLGPLLRGIRLGCGNVFFAYWTLADEDFANLQNILFAVHMIQLLYEMYRMKTTPWLAGEIAGLFCLVAGWTWWFMSQCTSPLYFILISLLRVAFEIVT